MRVLAVLAGFAKRVARYTASDPAEYDDQWVIDCVTLDHNEWRALEFLAKSAGNFEPLSESAGLSFVVANRLLETRLAERGRIAAPGEAYPMGYRLTALGSAVLKRGRHANMSGI